MYTALNAINTVKATELTEAELAKIGGGEAEEILTGALAAPVFFLEIVAVYLTYQICDAAVEMGQALLTENTTQANLNQTLDAIDEANGIPASRSKPDDFADAWGPFNGYTI